MTSDGSEEWEGITWYKARHRLIIRYNKQSKSTYKTLTVKPGQHSKSIDFSLAPRYHLSAQPTQCKCQLARQINMLLLI